MEFSKRTSWSNDSNPLSLKAEALRSAQIPILDLTESNPTRCAFEYLKNGWLEALQNPDNLNYRPDPQGLQAAREAVCDYYAGHKIKLDPGQIFLTAGTSEAYGYLFRLLADAGDAILVPKPGYPLLGYLADFSDA